MLITFKEFEKVDIKFFINKTFKIGRSVLKVEKKRRISQNFLWH